MFFAALNDDFKTEDWRKELKLVSKELPVHQKAEYVFKIFRNVCEWNENAKRQATPIFATDIYSINIIYIYIYTYIYFKRYLKILYCLKMPPLQKEICVSTMITEVRHLSKKVTGHK